MTGGFDRRPRSVECPAGYGHVTFHIRGRLTRMRPMRPDEAAIIHSWNNDPDVYQFWGSYDYRHKSLDEFLADTVGDAHFFAASPSNRSKAPTPGLSSG